MIEKRKENLGEVLEQMESVGSGTHVEGMVLDRDMTRWTINSGKAGDKLWKSVKRDFLKLLQQSSKELIF